MISDIFEYLTPAYVAIFTITAGLLLQVFIRINYTIKFYRAGGVSASKLASNPITALTWLWTIGKAQASNQLLPLFHYIYTYAKPETPDLVEINVTGGQRYLFTRSPEHIKTILTGKFADFGKGEEFHRVWKPFLGDSIFTTDGQQWQESRNLIRPMFMKTRVSDLAIFERWTDVMLKKMPGDGSTVEVQDLFYRMTIDVITDFLLGYSVNSLENPRNEFVKAFTDVQRWQTMLTVLM
jgi:cytochrome P450